MNSSQALGNCTAAAIPFPTIFGANFVNISAVPVLNFTVGTPNINDPYGSNNPPVDFCNVTLTHTHPGQKETLRTQIWLPINNSKWNGRFLMNGGGGWSAGWTLSYPNMNGALANGYATSTIDGGVKQEDSFSASAWALDSPGNVNYNLLEDFTKKGLYEGALASKSVIKSFYGSSPAYSYWQGCSQGGRQGYMFAQNYPDVFDGISANAPAINWSPFFFTATFPQQVLAELKLSVYPQTCEYNSLTVAAVAACDGLDGLVDGLISDPDLCTFDPQTLVGKPATLCNSSQTISQAAATAMKAAWDGPTTENGTTQLYYGYGREIDTTTEPGILANTCSSNGTCVPDRSTLFTDWHKYFVKKDPDFNISNVTREEWVSAFKAGQREYGTIIDTTYPDLTDFRKAGGKLLTYHGLADQLIPFYGTRDYYGKVAANDPHIGDYYRYFEAPGTAHCVPAQGGIPNFFPALIDWVEKGIKPETLNTTNFQKKQRKLCLYPRKAIFVGDPSSNYTANDFVCQ